MIFLFDTTGWNNMWNIDMHGNHHWFHIPKWSSLLCLLCICFYFLPWVILCAYVMVDLQQPTHVHATTIAKTCVCWQLYTHAHTFLPQHTLCHLQQHVHATMITTNLCVFDDYYAQLLLLDFSYNTNLNNYFAQYFFLIFFVT
jgi:hypothetical protein